MAIIVSRDQLDAFLARHPHHQPCTQQSHLCFSTALTPESVAGYEHDAVTSVLLLGYRTPRLRRRLSSGMAIDNDTRGWIMTALSGIGNCCIPLYFYSLMEAETLQRACLDRWSSVLTSSFAKSPPKNAVPLAFTIATHFFHLL